MEGEPQSWRLDFHDISYTLTVTATDALLRVEVEQCEVPSNRWIGDFQSTYIEDITSKTGNFKKFNTFTKMLVTALNQESDSVYVDLLTYSDLEILRAKKLGQAHPHQNGGNANTSASSASTRHHTKRYLILTYSGEFDRAHYPLPLSFEHTQSAESMQRTIDRLRRQLQAENARDVHLGKGAHPYNAASPVKSEGVSAGDLEERIRTLTHENATLERNYAALERESATELRHMKSEFRAVQSQLRDMQHMQDAQHDSTLADDAMRTRVYRLEEMLASERSKCSALEDTLEDVRAAAKRALNKHKKETAKLKEDLDGAHKDTMAMRSKVRELNRKLVAVEREKRTRAHTHASTPSSTTSAQRGRTRTRSKGSSGYLSGGSVGSGYGSGDSFNSRGSGRSGASGRSQTSQNSRTRTTRARTRRSPSPRFDPTAYQREKEQKRKATQDRRNENIRMNIRGRSRSHSRDSGYSSAGSSGSNRSGRSNRSNRSARSNKSTGSNRSRGSVTAPTMSSSRRTRTHTARPNIPRPTSAQSTRTAGQTTTTTTHSHSSTQKHAKHARSGSPRYASHTQNTRANSSRTAHSYTQYYDENGMGDVAKHAREHAWEDEHKHTRAPRETSSTSAPHVSRTHTHSHTHARAHAMHSTIPAQTPIPEPSVAAPLVDRSNFAPPDTYESKAHAKSEDEAIDLFESGRDYASESMHPAVPTNAHAAASVKPDVDAADTDTGVASSTIKRDETTVVSEARASSSSVDVSSTSAEISEIDRRLSQLQDFLRQAKEQSVGTTLRAKRDTDVPQAHTHTDETPGTENGGGAAS